MIYVKILLITRQSEEGQRHFTGEAIILKALKGYLNAPFNIFSLAFHLDDNAVYVCKNVSVLVFHFVLQECVTQSSACGCLRPQAQPTRTAM